MSELLKVETRAEARAVLLVDSRAALLVDLKVASKVVLLAEKMEMWGLR